MTCSYSFSLCVFYENNKQYCCTSDALRVRQNSLFTHTLCVCVCVRVCVCACVRVCVVCVCRVLGVQFFILRFLVLLVVMVAAVICSIGVALTYM